MILIFLRMNQYKSDQDTAASSSERGADTTRKKHPACRRAAAPEDEFAEPSPVTCCAKMSYKDDRAAGSFRPVAAWCMAATAGSVVLTE